MLIVEMSTINIDKHPATLTTPDEEPFEYVQLTGHKRTDGSYKTDKQLRMEYITLTDKLIETIQEGTVRKNPETGKMESQPFDNIIFLDKSARPVSWLVRELWDKLAFDEDGEKTPMPAMNFLNIDREQWIGQVDEEGTGVVDVSHLSPSIIRSLRSIFVMPNQKSDRLTEEIDEADATIDGKNVLIVDEVRSTGRTMNIAKKLLQRAFPTTHFDSAYWMGGQTGMLVRSSARGKSYIYGNADLPVWYRDDLETGRGVGNRQVDHLPVETTRTQRLGRWFLSRRFSNVDPSSVQLRKEIKQLAEHPDVPIRPSPYREDDDERLAILNNTTAELAQAAIDAINAETHD